MDNYIDTAHHLCPPGVLTDPTINGKFVVDSFR